VEIKPFSSAIKSLTKIQAELRSKGVLQDTKKQVSSASLSLVNPNYAMTEDSNPWFLGSKEADARFFVDNMIVSWRGLVDDNGNDVPFSRETAMEIFLENGEPGQQLYRELIASSLDTSLFVKTLEEQVKEDSKN